METMTITQTINQACNWAVNIAIDNSHGYDQIKRQGPDYDCSSLCINAYEQAGIPVKENGGTYTGNMRAAFVKCGFTAITYKKGMTLLRGDVVLNEKHHAVLYIGNGQIVQASINEKGTTTGGKTGDQTGREIAVGSFYEYKKGWDYVLRYSKKDNEVVKVNIEMTQIQSGSNCAEVGTLQALLNALGFVGKNGKPLSTDHDFGGNTDYAVRNFQKSVGLNPDGIVGKKTWDKILKADY